MVEIDPCSLFIVYHFVINVGIRNLLNIKKKNILKKVYSWGK